MCLKKKLIKIKGQITIFVAFVFMVLFTLFGMTISMGMFVHDKINLQNATDLASYYVATKQAEMLTAIAHSNYQIRQSWKLAAFRYRVIGNGARTEGSLFHPGLGNNATGFTNNHNTYKPAQVFVKGNTWIPPRICIGAAHMFKELYDDNACSTIDFKVDYLSGVSARVLGGIIGQTNDHTTAANISIHQTCSGTSYVNWWFANTIVGSHKLEQRDRRAVIHALAKNLALPITLGGMRDLEGKSVYEGAKKTFLFNLSESNREDRNAASIEFINSMEGLSPEQWLNPIYINTIIPYSIFEQSSSCSERLETHASSVGVNAVLASGNGAGARAFKKVLDPDNQIEYYGFLGAHSDEFLNLSLGVEKNPWYMVYNKATGRAVSKPLFLNDIFGLGININAIAYSKPFGGRIGPWYKSQWSSGSFESNSGYRTDSLLPPRVSRGDLAKIQDPLDKTLFPNYSRFPGDKQGLTTKASMVAAGQIIGAWGIHGTSKTSLSHYYRATYSYTNDSYNDPLAQNIFNPSGPWEAFNRRLEIAAIAPDIFDMTYYTIVPGFYDYFIDGPNGKLKDWLPVPDGVEVRGDIGSYEGPMVNFDIQDQMEISKLSEAKDGVKRKRLAPWLNSTNKQAFLSSWISGDVVMNYDSANESAVKSKFATCHIKVPSGRPKIPSECLRGGRSGYSVKIISKGYLQADHPIGGQGISGQIRNVY